MSSHNSGTNGTAPNQSAAGAAATSTKKPQKRLGHPANPYILFYADFKKANGGNIYKLAKVASRIWKELPVDVRRQYKQQYLQNRGQLWRTQFSSRNYKPSNRWINWPKVHRHTAYLSKKKKLELAAKAAEEAAKAAEEAAKAATSGQGQTQGAP